jgi:hypothetical protein
MIFSGIGNEIKSGAFGNNVINSSGSATTGVTKGLEKNHALVEFGNEISVRAGERL